MRIKQMTAILAACLLAALTACGGNKQASEPAAGQDAAQAEEAAAGTTEAEAMTEETTEAQESAGTEGSADLYVWSMEENPMSAEADGLLLAEGGYMTVSLSEAAAAAYPQLQAALEAYDQEIMKGSEEAFEEIRAAAESFRKDFDGKPEEFPSGRMVSEIEVLRFDEKVLSLCKTIDCYYPGAAHGLIGYAGANFDAATGEKLACTDVIADMAAAEDLVAENLTAVDGSAVTVEKELLDVYFAEDGDMRDELVWLLDTEGVTFRFEPSALTGYAAGTLEARILFEEHPELFTPEWR